MKVKSLFLGSAAAVALSSGAMAADPIGVALDTCSMLDITGLTVSSESDCLKFSGEVSYAWNWNLTDNETRSRLDWELKTEATASSDFGPAKAVIVLKDDHSDDGDNTNDTNNAVIGDVYVAIGDQTVIMAGKKGSIAKKGDDETFTALFSLDGRPAVPNFAASDEGLSTATNTVTGGHVIQVTSDLGNGVDVALGLEDLGANYDYGVAQGSLVGAIGVDQDWGTAHLTFIFDDFTNNAVNNWSMHGGATFNVDAFSVRAAFVADNANNWEGLLTGKATMDMFILAAGVEFDSANNWEAAVSAEAEVSEDATIYAAVRFENDNTWDVSAKGKFAVSDNLTASAQVTFDQASQTAFAADLDWAPGGGFTANVGYDYTKAGDSIISTKFKKSFE